MHRLMCLLLFLACTTQAASWWSPTVSSTPFFSDPKIIDVTSYLNIGQLNGTIAAFGDFNNDKHTDLFVVSCDGNCLRLYTWNHLAWRYDELPKAIIYQDYISEVVLSDFNVDGFLDALVTSAPSPDNTLQQFVMYLGDGNTFSKFKEFQNGSLDHVLMLDANADMKVDLFGTTESGARAFWINTVPPKSTDPSQQVFQIDLQRNETQHSSLRPLASPATNAFVDIDGDCAADLIVMSCESTHQRVCINPGLEIWLNRNDGFHLDKLIELPTGSGVPAFADFNHDGNMDILVPVCYPPGNCSQANEVYILFNEQKPMCQFFGTNCRSSQNLCESSDFQFNISRAVRLQLKDEILEGFQVSHTRMPGSLRVGDYNLDGYPDFIAVTRKPNALAQVQLWKNVACNSERCTNDAVNNGLRTFDIETFNVDALTSFISVNATPFAACFIDFDDTGILDMLVMYKDQDGVQRVKAFYNNLFNDAYFLKTMGLQGLQAQKAYGAFLPGTTIKFTITDTYGIKQARMGIQFSQTSYMALQTPYVLFGLGRTTGLIEEFFVGVPRMSQPKDNNWRLWQGLIPNAQLVVIPWPNSDWELELFVNPSDHTFWVMIAVVSALVLLGVPIIILQLVERRQDQLAKKQETSQGISGVFIG